MSRTSEEKQRAMRDVARAEITAKMIEDALWRFNDESEESLTVYDLVNGVVQDMIVEGLCPACLRGAIDDAFERAEVDTDTHVAGDEAGPPKRSDDSVFH